VAFEGATDDLISQAVATVKTGTVATQLVETNKAVGIRVVAPNSRGLTTADLEAIPVRAPDGHIFPLSRVASIVPISGQPQIGSENLQPMVAVTGRIEGRGKADRQRRAGQGQRQSHEDDRTRMALGDSDEAHSSTGTAGPAADVSVSLNRTSMPSSSW
jgi:multidrug efflux pump subunit AcrB